MPGLSAMVDPRIRPDKRTDLELTSVSTPRRIWTLIVACAGVTLVISSMIALNTALGDIAVATSATQNQLTWVVDGYTLVLACLLLPAGAIGDRYGRRGALLVGLAIFSAASIAPVIFNSPMQIILSRALAGAGAAFVMPATLSLLTVVYPPEERTKAVGIWAGVAGCGGVLGMLGSGALLHFWSWQSIFWTLGVVGAVLFALTLTVSPSRDSDAPPVDWPGAAVIGSAIALFVFGLIEAPSRGWTNPLVSGCLAAGLTLAGVFGVVELRRRKPLLDVRLFGNPNFATGAGTIMVVFLTNFGLFYLIMQYFQLIMGYSPIHTAIAVAPLMAGIAALSAMSSWYLPKVGLRTVLFLGLVFMSAGILSLLSIELHSTYSDLLWRFMILSVGMGLCTAPPTSAIMHAVPDNKQGVASAVNDAAREVGAAIGIAVAGSILAARYGGRLMSNLSGFPQPVRSRASDSLAEAMQISKDLGPPGNQLAQISQTAFLHAMQSSLLVLGIVIAVAAVLIGLWSPGRDGQQLRLIRRLRLRRELRSLTGADEFGRAVGEHDDGRVRAAAGDRR